MYKTFLLTSKNSFDSLKLWRSSHQWRSNKRAFVLRSVVRSPAAVRRVPSQRIAVLSKHVFGFLVFTSRIVRSTKNGESMSYTGFGRTSAGVLQMAWVVEDLDSAIRTWVEEHGVGPWFQMTNFAGADAVYRGRPSTASITLAMSFSGTMCVELIQPDDDQPSIFNEHVERHGYGFHHYGKLATDLEAEIDRYAANGHELVFRTTTPTGAQLAYVDTTKVLHGYQELIEVDSSTDPMFKHLYSAALNWDGKDPVRPFG